MANSGSIFGLPEFKPYGGRFLARVNTFSLLRRYYNGNVYESAEFKRQYRLYGETKSLLSFLARAVDLDVALIPGVMDPWALGEDTPAATLTAQQQLYEWSSWPITSDDWIEDGATCGEAFLKIVDLPGMVQLQRLKPELCMLTSHLDPATQQVVDLALIVDKAALDAAGETYEYAEAITPMQIRTYRNGDPWGYDGNPDRYDNPLGFVPVVAAQNDSQCRSTFDKCLPQLDSVNELASFITNIIGQNAAPQWVVIGAEQSNLEKSSKLLWDLPAGADVKAVVPVIDIPGALLFIQELKAETKANLPELAFDDLRAKAQIATETLEVQLVELDAKIWKMRRRYDQSLIRAHQMAALAAGLTGVQGLGPLLLPHKMDFKRPVRPISEMEQIALENARMGRDMQKMMLSGDGMTQLQGIQDTGYGIKQRSSADLPANP